MYQHKYLQSILQTLILTVLGKYNPHFGAAENGNMLNEVPKVTQWMRSKKLNVRVAISIQPGGMPVQFAGPATSKEGSRNAKNKSR